MFKKRELKEKEKDIENQKFPVKKSSHKKITAVAKLVEKSYKHKKNEMMIQKIFLKIN
jgi:hypothetical protein